MRLILFAAAAALAACTPPSQTTSVETTEPTTTVQTACNTLTPDPTKRVQLTQDNAAAALADLAGGPITPGAYDLANGSVGAGASAWPMPRAVALDVAETANGTVFNYASDDPADPRWTATLREGPPSAIEYTCGRIGNAEITFAATPTQLRLRMPGSNGEGFTTLVFAKRSA